MRLALALGVAGGLGVAGYAESRPGLLPGASEAALAERAELAADPPADRAVRPTASDTSPSPVAPSPTVTTAPTTAAPKSKPKPKPTRPRPVAGLTQAQMDNANTIVKVGRQLGVPRRGLVVAIATAMQESNLYNLANGGVPESLELPNQGVGYDHDSVGLFQQRPSSGWGEVADLMRPAYAAQQFYEALLEIPGWKDMAVSVAAQSVQVSAFPDAYAQHEDRATTVVEALV